MTFHIVKVSCMHVNILVSVMCLHKHTCIQFICELIRAGTNTPSDEYDTYRDTGWRIRYVSRIHFFSEAKLGNG